MRRINTTYHQNLFHYVSWHTTDYLSIYLFVQGPHLPTGRNIRDEGEAMLQLLRHQLHGGARQRGGLPWAFHHVRVQVSSVLIRASTSVSIKEFRSELFTKWLQNRPVQLRDRFKVMQKLRSEPIRLISSESGSMKEFRSELCKKSWVGISRGFRPKQITDRFNSGSIKVLRSELFSEFKSSE